MDNLEAKCLYCGGKMDTLITTLQDEIISLTGLTDETENTLLLSVAGLKHVRVWYCMATTTVANNAVGAGCKRMFIAESANFL